MCYAKYIFWLYRFIVIILLCYIVYKLWNYTVLMIYMVIKNYYERDTYG